MKAVAEITTPIPIEICARMLPGHDAISSHSCLVRELHGGQKKWITTRCEFLLSLCLENGGRGRRAAPSVT
jgi:hypothetical protein